MPKPPSSALISAPELPVMVAPIAAPPMIVISTGKACRITPMLPPDTMKPPNTRARRTTMPMAANISSLVDLAGRRAFPSRYD